MKHFNLGAKINLLVLILSLVLIAVVATIGYVEFIKTTDELAERQVQTSVEFFKNKIDECKYQSERLAVGLTSNTAFVKALESKDHDKTLAILTDLMKKSGMDFITATDANCVVVARSHSPNKYGDKIDNQYNMQQALLGKVASAIEPGTAVKLSARAGAPVYNEAGKLIGVVSTGFDLSKTDLLDTLKKATGNEFTVFFGDERLSTTVIKEGKRATGTKAEPKVAEQVIKNKTKFIGKAPVVGIEHLTAYIPLIGPNGESVGMLFSGVSLESVKTKLNKVVIWVSLIGVFGFALFLIVLYWMINRIAIKPLKENLSAAKKIAKGDLNFSLIKRSKDEIGELTDAMNIMKTIIANLVAQVNSLSESAIAGKLDKRADSKQFEGDFATVVDGVNSTLDALIRPMNVSAEYVDRISKGDIPPHITDEYRGDFSEIKNNINQMIDTLNFLASDLKNTSNKQLNGDKDAYANTTMLTGVFSEIGESYNSALKTLNENIGKILNVMLEYGAGNLDVVLEKMPGKQVIANQAMDKVRDNLLGVSNEIESLIEASIKGRLDYRGNSSAFSGVYKNMIDGFNSSLDAIIKPINVASEYMERISNGDIPNRITDEYKGDFNSIKNSLNSCIENINALVTDGLTLAEQAKIGSLLSRADADRHSGKFRAIIQGFNKTMDIVVGYLDLMPAPAMIIDKDFNIKYLNKAGAELAKKKQSELINSKCYNYLCSKECNTDKCACSLAMKGDKVVTSKTSAVPAGKQMEIGYTGSPIKDENGKVIGAFEFVVDLTDTQRNIDKASKIAAYQEIETEKISNCLNKLANGDTNFAIEISAGDSDTEQAKATFEIIAGAVINCVSAIERLSTDINTLSESAIKGELSTRVDITKHQGDYRMIVNGINGTLDSVIQPIQDASNVLVALAVNDTSLEMSTKYSGDWVEFRNSVASVSDRVQSVVAIVNNLSNGNLADIKNLKQIGKRSAKDELVPALIRLGDNLENVLIGANEYIEKIKAGDIDNIKFDSNKYQGVFRNIFDGFNETAKAMSEPLIELAVILENMSNADFTKDMQGNYSGTFAELKHSVNKTLEAITQVFGQIINTAVQVERGAIQVSDTSGALSQGATEQAASLEEMTSSMSEVSSQTKRNAENAEIANKLAQESRDYSDKGEREMKELLNAMSEISSSSANIQKIIKVIDEIAFQTNLLALNAAVEAARAGVHGQGFAVVAEEVRNLAARSARAAKETADMIEGSIKTVEHGGVLSNRTQDALNEIRLSATKVSDLISEIAVASNEQSQGISQINIGLNQIDKVTQQNTASSEESATSAEELSNQARKLKRLLERFKIKNSGETFDDDFGLSERETRRIQAKAPKALPNSMNSQQRHDFVNDDIQIDLDSDDFGRF